jgi:hypothetical protein
MGARPETLDSYLNVAVETAKTAGQIILSNFNNSKTVEHKGKVDLVTETDKACESLIFEYLKTAFPSHQVRDLQFVIEFLACSDSVVSLLFCSLLACLHS